MVDFIGSELSGYKGLGGIPVSKFTAACLKGCAAHTHPNRSCKGGKCGEMCKNRCSEHALKVSSGEMGPGDACKKACEWREVMRARKDNYFTDKPCQNACNTEVGKLVEAAEKSEIDLTTLLAPTPTPTYDVAKQQQQEQQVPSTSLITKLLVPLGLGVVALLIIGGTVYFVKRSRVKKIA